MLLKTIVSQLLSYSEWNKNYKPVSHLNIIKKVNIHIKYYLMWYLKIIKRNWLQTKPRNIFTETVYNNLINNRFEKWLCVKARKYHHCKCKIVHIIYNNNSQWFLIIKSYESFPSNVHLSDCSNFYRCNRHHWWSSEKQGLMLLEQTFSITMKVHCTKKSSPQNVFQLPLATLGRKTKPFYLPYEDGHLLRC